MARLSKARQKGGAEINKTKQAQYNDILIDQRPCKTWPARRPAYCFTALCPDLQYRPEGGMYIKWPRT